MELQYKAAAFELKAEPGEDGIFEGYASVFDVLDQGFDVVKPGAFRKSLESGRKVRLLWQHDMDKPIGVWEALREDERGLFVRGRLSGDVQQGKEALALLRMGALDSMSIGYRVIAASEEAGGRVRALDEVELLEISLVTFPMNTAATVTDVKSIATIREFERAMRDAGFSQKEAKAIAAAGYRGLAEHRDDVEAWTEAGGLDPVLDQLRQLKESLSA